MAYPDKPKRCYPFRHKWRYIGKAKNYRFCVQCAKCQYYGESPRPMYAGAGYQDFRGVHWVTANVYSPEDFDRWYANVTKFAEDEEIAEEKNRQLDAQMKINKIELQKKVASFAPDSISEAK